MTNSGEEWLERLEQEERWQYAQSLDEREGGAAYVMNFEVELVEPPENTPDAPQSMILLHLDISGAQIFPMVRRRYSVELEIAHRLVDALRSAIEGHQA